MKFLKASICGVLAIAMSLSMCACSNNESASTEGDVVVDWLLPISEQPDGQAIMDAVSEIAKEKIGVSLNMTFIDLGSYKERMTMMMASGTSFDLCFAGYLNPYANAVRNGSFLELDSLMEKETPELLKTIPDYAWEGSKINGKIYAVPNLQCFTGARSVMLYKDLVDKYNFDADSIKKIEDVEPFLDLIKKNEPTLYPYRLNYGPEMWTYDAFHTITSPIVLRRDGSTTKVEILQESPEYEKAISVLSDWYKKGYIRADILSASTDIQDYNAGRYAVNQAQNLPGAEAEATAKIGREILLRPVTDSYLESTTGTMTAIGVNSKHPVEALKMIELVNTDKEVFNLLKLGIKDKHYSLDEEGKYKLIEGSGYQSIGGWVFGSEFNSLLAAGQADNTYTESARMNEEAKRSPLLGFTLNTDNIKTELSQVSSIVGEYGTARMITGDFKALRSEMMGKLKKAGIDTLIADIQKQVDEFLASK